MSGRVHGGRLEALPGSSRFQWRWVLFSLIPMLAVLGIAEAGLRLLPSVLQWQHRSSPVPIEAADSIIACLGDSVTYGIRLPPAGSYPAQLQAHLTASGYDRISVLNLATPGARARMARGQLEYNATQLPRGVPTLVLLEIGHNDFVDLDLSRRSPGKTIADGQTYPTRENRSAQLPDLQLLRVAQWAAAAWRNEPTRARFSPERLQEYQAEIARIDAMTRAAGQTLVLLTYLVPGEPSQIGTVASADIVNTRQMQQQINEIIRETARSRRLPLIDLERLVPVPGSWDPRYFLDNIHPTEATNRLVAQAVVDQLALEPSGR